MQLIKKISTKTVMGGRPEIPKEEGKSMWLWEVVGIASGIKTGESANGPYTGLTGNFQALNKETGEIFRSGVCYPPAVALDLVTGQLGAKDVQSVQFAFNIGVRADKSTATGYVYVAEPLVQITENDPLESLLTKVKQQALPAPQKKKSA